MISKKEAEIMSIIKGNTPCKAEKVFIWCKKRAENFMIINHLAKDELLCERSLYGEKADVIRKELTQYNYDSFPAYFCLTPIGLANLEEYESYCTNEKRQDLAEQRAKLSLIFSLLALIVSFFTMLISLIK